jgi:hypothetical protein
MVLLAILDLTFINHFWPAFEIMLMKKSNDFRFAINCKQ